MKVGKNMKNIEKFRDKLLESVNVCNWYDYFNSDADCVQDCEACEERFVKWLFEDSEKQVLDEKEREYLSSVIKPFKKRVTSVRKWFNGIDYRIIISLDHGGNLCQLPRFPLSSEMYKGMDSNKCYTLQELGL